jgi:TPR repeat protein
MVKSMRSIFVKRFLQILMTSGILVLSGCNYANRSEIADLEAKAEQGVIEAQFQLAAEYYSGEKISQDYKKAYKLWHPLANRGIAAAQLSIAEMHLNGKGIEQDPATAFKWYKAAADQGHANAQNNLGVLYQQGIGTKKDYKKAAELYRKAAEKKHVVAEFHLAELYAQGKGVNKDMNQAFKWYRAAAEREYLPAIYNAIVIGHKQKVNTKYAAELLNKLAQAAAEGNQNANAVLKKLAAAENIHVNIRKAKS